MFRIKSFVVLIFLECLCENYVFASKAEEKCVEYTEIIKNTVGNEPLAIVSPVVPHGSFGKVEASPGEFPHMAGLGFVNKNNEISWNCGGILISDQHVLTGATCVRGAHIGPVKKIRLGAFNLKAGDTDPNVQDFTADSVILHPNVSGASLYHDIAVIKLDRKVTFTKYVLPACLQTTEVSTSDNLVATGWGVTEIGSSGSDKLMKVDLELFTNEECRTIFGTMRRLKDGITDDMLCVGSHTSGKGTCQGDSGGPVQILKSANPRVYSIAGVVSFGKSCGIVGQPEVATRVSSYIPWIERNVWQ